nr:ASCH domain-containing protein [Clostridium botulinum]
MITNFHGDAKCIIKTKHVDVIPFSKVKVEFMFKEGEGDKSLEY